MKNSTIFFLLLCSICTLAVFSSCKKDKSSKPKDPSQDYFMTARVDGVPFEAVNGAQISKIDDTIYLILGGYGTNATERIQITLYLPTPNITGTFTVSNKEVTFSYFPDINANNEVYVAGDGIASGTVTITERTNDYTKGTFSCTPVLFGDTVTVNITQGEFKAINRF